jgi:hypothetical protein
LSCATFNKALPPNPHHSEKRKPLRFGDSGLLFGGIAVVSLAVIGTAGLIWKPIYLISRYAIVYATIFAVTFLVLGIKDLLNLGWSWKRAAAIVVLLVAFGLVALAIHELRSGTPFLQKN